MTARHMPPGAIKQLVPGSRMEDNRAAFFEALEDKAAEFGEKVPEGKLADWLWEQIEAAYARGHGDGVSDESMARVMQGGEDR